MFISYPLPRLKYHLFSHISGLAIVHYYSLNKKLLYQNLFLAFVDSLEHSFQMNKNE